MRKPLLPQRMFVQSAVEDPGIRTHKITIRNEKDRIKVKQKGWLDKKEGGRDLRYTKCRALQG